MAWNYRKRVKIAPGVYMNISKNGVSTSVGVRGASVTFGRNGTFVNTGIPGTGFYNRQKIGQGSRKSPSISNIPQPKKSNDLSNAGCFTFGFVCLGCFAALLTGYYLWWFFALVSLIIGLICIAAQSVKQSNIDGQAAPAYLTEAKSAHENSKNQTVRRILESFIDSYQLLDQIDDEEKILDKLYEKPHKNADRIDEHNQTLAELKDKLESAQYDVDAELDDNLLPAYGNLCEAFEQLQDCDKVWLITSQQATTEHRSSAVTSVVRKDGCVFGGVFNYMKSQFDIPAFEVTGGVLYLYPKFAILAQRPGAFQVVSYNYVSIRSAMQRFNEEEGLPSDATVDGYTWRYVNKNGGPDRRFANNAQIPVAVYAEVTINYNQKQFTFHFSNYDKAKRFAQAFAAYKAALGYDIANDGDSLTKTLRKVNELVDITNKLNQQRNAAKSLKDVYPLARESAYNLFKYLQQLNDNDDLRSVLAKIQCDDTSATSDLSKDTEQNRIFPTLDNRLALFALMDIIKCYERLCKTDKIDFKPECLPLAMLLTLVATGSTTIWDNVEFITDGTFKIAQGYYDVVKKTCEATDIGDKFYIIEFLRSSQADDEIANRYAVLLYRFSMAIANADGTITPDEKQWLTHLLSFTNENQAVHTDSAKRQRPKSASEQHEAKRVRRGNAIKELNSLIGLDSVKNDVENIYNLIRIQNAREAKGMKTSKISYHCVFTGNPGTGKTTVARLVAQIYKDLGIINKGHLVETDRSGLVAEYVGQTAVKTNKIIDSALDGVLFIDEAYSLVQGGNNDFGMEAISTLLKRMEDDRDRLIVILAGYSDEMKQFIDANPGLQSRFNRYISFEDYSADDLAAIYSFNLKKYEYKLSDDAVVKLRQVLTDAVANKDKNFGNARYVRNLFEKTLENQARRLASVTALDEDILAQITAADIPNHP